MDRFFRFLLLSLATFALTVAPVAAFAQGATAAAQPPSPEAGPPDSGERVLEAPTAWPQERGDLKADPAAVFGRLPNGLRYVILPNAEPPGRASLRLHVAAGSLMEEDDQQGLAHFLEHMAFNGTEHFKAGEMVEFFQRIGMAFGADNNAHTSFEETTYKVDVPETKPDLLNPAFQVLADYAGGMLLLPAEIDRERGVILSEKRARDSVPYRTFVARWKFLFPESRLSQRFPIGEEAVIAKAPVERFVAFYRKWYAPSRMTVVVVGDVKPAEIVPYVEKYFGGLKAAQTPTPSVPLGKVATPQLAVTLHSEPEAPATQLTLMTLRPFDLGADSRGRRERELAIEAASFILSRRLERLAEAENAPFSKGNAYHYDFLDFVEAGAVDLVCRPEQWKDALPVAERELRRALQYGFTAAEIGEAKAKLLNDYEQAAKTAPTRKSRGLADALASSLSENRVFTHPTQDLALAREFFVKLTPATCLAAFRQLWGKDSRYVFVSGNLSLPKPEESIRAVYTESVARPVEAPAEAKVTPFGYGEFGEPGKIVERKVHEDLAITQVRFANNVRVNVKRTPFEAKVVRVALRAGAGKLEASASEPGLPAVSEAVFIGGGLQKHSHDELKAILAGHTVDVEFDVDEDAFVLSGATSPEDFRLQLNLMCAYLLEPGYRPEAFRQARRGFDRLYLQLLHTPEGVLRDQVVRFLAGGDFRFGMPPRETVDRVDADLVRAWLERPLKQGYLEVSVVGDIDPEVVLREAASTFGALPVRAEAKPAYAAQRVLNFPAAQKKAFPVETEIPKGFAVAYWPTDDIWDVKRTRRLNILASVLSDRLRVIIRQELGESYSPYASSQASETYTDYGVFFGLSTVDPKLAERIAERIVGIATELAAQGVGPDEFARAIKPALASLGEVMRTNGYWLNRVLLRSQEYPVTLDWCRAIQQDYAAIKPEELSALAKEYLKAERAVQVVVLPPSGESRPPKYEGGGAPGAQPGPSAAAPGPAVSQPQGGGTASGREAGR